MSFNRDDAMIPILTHYRRILSEYFLVSQYFKSWKPYNFNNELQVSGAIIN